MKVTSNLVAMLMTMRKLFALLLGVVFLFGTTAVAVAGEKPTAKTKRFTGIVKSVSPESLVVEKGKKEWASVNEAG